LTTQRNLDGIELRAADLHWSTRLCCVNRHRPAVQGISCQLTACC